MRRAPVALRRGDTMKPQAFDRLLERKDENLRDLHDTVVAKIGKFLDGEIDVSMEIADEWVYVSRDIGIACHLKEPKERVG